MNARSSLTDEFGLGEVAAPPPRRKQSRWTQEQLQAVLPPGSNAELFAAPKAKKPKKASKEDAFAFQCRTYQLPEPVRQLRFAKEAMGRLWMFDFAWPTYMLALEVEGLDVHVVPNAKRKSGKEFVVGGRHATVDGIQEDMIKYNSALKLGWGVLRFSQTMVTNGTAIAELQEHLYARGWRR